MRQAVVIIHGMGEQRPLATIRQFVSVITDGLVRSKPDRMSESFELRRFALAETNHLPPTDVYELYWAHHMARASWSVALGWLRKLIFRRTSSLPRGLRPLQRALVVLSLVAVAATFYSAVQAFGEGDGLRDFLTSAMTYTPVIALLLQWIIGEFALGYIGDAARYFVPNPENIEARTKIRAEGVKLLRHLHESKTYSRVVVVGHSLGSVIGYDVLRHLWDELRKPSFEVTGDQPEAKSFEAAVAAVIDPPAGQSKAEAVDAFQKAQHRLWREQRSLRTPWLVTDFVTFGSPLAHAELLLEDPVISFDRRKDEREIPTCPPTSDEKRAHYPEEHDVAGVEGGRKFYFQIPNHGAVFAATRWTNLYFPHRRLILGDVVGGPLAEVFGRGIRDVPVRPNKRGLWPRTLASHVMYWRKETGESPQETGAAQKEARKETDEITGTKDVIVALRSALLLDAKRSKEVWPNP